MRYIEVVQKDEQKKKGGGFVNAKCPVCKQVIKVSQCHHSKRVRDQSHCVPVAKRSKTVQEAGSHHRSLAELAVSQ